MITIPELCTPNVLAPGAAQRAAFQPAVQPGTWMTALTDDMADTFLVSFKSAGAAAPAVDPGGDAPAGRKEPGPGVPGGQGEAMRERGGKRAGTAVVPRRVRRTGMRVPGATAQLRPPR